MKWLMRILEKGKKKKAGFTLIELMVVVIVVGILAAAAVPIYRFAMSRAYSSEAKATCGTIRASELVYYTEQVPNAYLVDESDEATASGDLMALLGVDTSTNTWWHAGSNDSDAPTCSFGFGAMAAANTMCGNLGLTVAGNYVYAIGESGSINGIELAMNIDTGIWYHYWP